MDISNPLHRRQFMKLSALAATAAAVSPAISAGQTPEQELPKLPYGYDALEPHIDAETMEIHHSKHHAAYIANMNKAVAGAEAPLPKELETLLRELPKVGDESLRMTLRNNAGGHWNHDFFWKSLAPATASGAPSNGLTTAINSEFGSMEDFKTKFGEAATSRFGSGWAWLIVQDGKLKIVSTPNQDNPLMQGVVPEADLGMPLLGLDVWEHAYYLNYQNKRAEYITAFWNVVNWAEVSERHAAAMKG